MRNPLGLVMPLRTFTRTLITLWNSGDASLGSGLTVRLINVAMGDSRLCLTCVLGHGGLVCVSFFLEDNVAKLQYC